MRVETIYEQKLKIKKNQQTQFRRFVTGKGSGDAVVEYIGMNMLETRKHVEGRMIDPMTWGNYGSLWVIDHILPFWVFDMHNRDQLRLLWHPDNLMPMFWKHNHLKQGHLRFAIEVFSIHENPSVTTERLLDMAIAMDKELDIYKNAARGRKAKLISNA